VNQAAGARRRRELGRRDARHPAWQDGPGEVARSGHLGIKGKVELKIWTAYEMVMNSRN